MPFIPSFITIFQRRSLRSFRLLLHFQSKPRIFFFHSSFLYLLLLFRAFFLQFITILCQKNAAECASNDCSQMMCRRMIVIVYSQRKLNVLFSSSEASFIVEMRRLIIVCHESGNNAIVRDSTYTHWMIEYQFSNEFWYNSFISTQFDGARLTENYSELAWSAVDVWSVHIDRSIGASNGGIWQCHMTFSIDNNNGCNNEKINKQNEKKRKKNQKPKWRH